MSTQMRLFEIAESSHRILNPITLDKLMMVGEILQLSEQSRVLDLCCGKAEMIAQWAKRFGCSAHGVDISEVYLRAAHERARELGVHERLTLDLRPAGDFATDELFDVVSCIGATWFAGSLTQSLERMRVFTKPTGTFVVGECYWVKDPSGEAVAALGDEFEPLPGLFDRFEAAGLEVVEMVLTDGDGWDRYCAAQWKNLYEWVLANPDDPDAPAAKHRLAVDRRTHVEVQRDYLGWGVFVLKPSLA